MVCIFVTTNNTSAQNIVRDPERFENTSSSRRCLYERVSVLVSHHKRGVCIVGGNTVVCFGCLCLSSRNTGRFISYFSHRRCQECFLLTLPHKACFALPSAWDLSWVIAEQDKPDRVTVVPDPRHSSCIETRVVFTCVAKWEPGFS